MGPFGPCRIAPNAGADDERDDLFPNQSPTLLRQRRLVVMSPGALVIARRPSPPVAWLVAATAALAALAIAFIVANLMADRRSGEPVVAPARTAPRSPPPIEEQRLLEVPPETARTINAGRPIIAEPLPPARPFRFAGAAEAGARAIDCLAAASWYEIGDDAVGQRAVMQVVLNRVRHPAFPSSVCGVVLQGSERVTGCQFTFTCDGSLVGRRPSAAAWERARALAKAALAGAVDADVGYATHYHADYVVPYWASSQDKIAQVGPHIFYRWRGFWGTRAAFGRSPATAEPQVAALAFLSPAHVVEGAPPLVPTLLPVDAAALDAPLPPPMAVAGVREKSLRGALVRGAQTDANGFFLQLDAGVFPGNYATAAVALCRTRTTCTVLGWTDASRMGRALPLTEPQRQALSFQFVKRSEADTRALWNCRQFPRSNKAQCLPDAGPPPSPAAAAPRAAQ